MPTTSTTPDRRDDKARFALASSGQWLRLRDRATGRIVAYAIPSASRPGQYHVARPESCSCEDFQRGNRCYHSRAAALEVARARARQSREGVPAA